MLRSHSKYKIHVIIFPENTGENIWNMLSGGKTRNENKWAQDIPRNVFE